MFNTLEDLLRVIDKEQNCIDYLEKMRWEDGIESPFDKDSQVYVCKNNRYKCKNTGKYFNVKTGTIFEGSKVSLSKWFLAMWLCTNHKKGISSIQLGKRSWYNTKDGLGDAS